MLELLPEHQRSELQRMTAKDITLDTAAIETWRAGKRNAGRSE
jgi:hypothetical protein